MKRDFNRFAVCIVGKNPNEAFSKLKKKLGVYTLYPFDNEKFSQEIRYAMARIKQARKPPIKPTIKHKMVHSWQGYYATTMYFENVYCLFILLPVIPNSDEIEEAKNRKGVNNENRT